MRDLPVSALRVAVQAAAVLARQGPLTPQGGCTGMLGPGNLDQEWISPFAWVLSLTSQMYAQSTQLDELIIAVLSPSSHFIILGFFDDFSII